MSTFLTARAAIEAQMVDGSPGSFTISKHKALLLGMADALYSLCGVWDASAGSFPPSALEGTSYVVSVAGTVDGVSFAIGDRLLCLVDSASTSTYASNWLKLDYSVLVESVAGKTGAVTLVQSDISGLVAALAAKAQLTALPKNYVDNPGLRISQENGTNGGTSNGYYFADQWVMYHSQDGTLTAAQVASATPGGSTHRGQITVTGADTSLSASQFAVFQQNIEGLRVSDLGWGTSDAVDVVVRFMRNFPAGTYACVLGNQDGDRSYVREFTVTGGEDGVDTVTTLTFPGDTSGTWDTDNTLSLKLIITIATGSTYQTTADAWQSGEYFGTSSTSNGIGTGSDVFQIGDVGIYADPNSTGLAPDFVLPDYAEDLAVCQRYYCQVSVHNRFNAPAPAANAVTLYWPVSMRVGPTLTLTAGSRNNVGGTAVDSGTFLTGRFEVSSVSSGDCYALNEIVTANARM